MKKALISFTAIFLLSACGMNNYAKTSLSRKNLNVTSTDNFKHCYAYGCVKKADIVFEPEDWDKIESIMLPGAVTPEDERKKIAHAIGAFENIVGIKAGTSTDKAGTFVHMMEKDNQHDCVDESLNTTIYLTLLEQKGLLRHHNVEDPTVRLPIIHSGRWPHQTAVISEIETSKFYAVDSWFHDNGAKAEIVPLRKWKDGWKPKKEGKTAN